MTRDEKKAITRTKLIDAAAEVFAEKGFALASLDEVADRAGLTKGAVYSNFDSKDDLLEAVLFERLFPRQAVIPGMVSTDGTLEEQARQSGRLYIDMVRDERTWMLLDLELAIHAARHPNVRSRYAGHYDAFRAEVAKTIEEHADGALPLPASDLATGYFALGAGIALQKLRDPDSVPDELFGEMLALIGEGIAARQAAARRPPRGSRGRRPRSPASG